MTAPTLPTTAPIWAPWKQIARFSAQRGAIVEGPHSVSVWQRQTDQISVTFHNRTGTWSTALTLTSDEALALAQNLLTAVRDVRNQAE